MAFVVAIDGPAGAGKGTITKLVGEKLNLINIDTGAMYRCVSLYMIRNNIDLDNIEKIEEMLSKIKIEQRKNEEGIDEFYLEGENVSFEIRKDSVNNIVSPVSHIPIVREKMVELQRKIALEKDVIMEGRDIGTNVFPNADVKIYLDATAEERANRRLKQNMEKGITSSYEEILKGIIVRDNNDKTSNVAPLKQAEDAIYVDSTELNIEEVTQKIIEIINKVREKND